MDGFREKLIRFMQGRYGADELFYILTATYLLMTVVNIFAQLWILHIAGLVLFAVAVLRSLSKNIPARQKENELVVGALGKIGIKRRPKPVQPGRDMINFAYKKCPGCGKTLRLPRRKGKHNTKCPSCGKEFRVKIR